MSACDLVDIFDRLGITEDIIMEAGDSFSFYDKEELADYLTYIDQKDVLKTLLGSNHILTKKYNKKINDLLN